MAPERIRFPAISNSRSPLSGCRNQCSTDRRQRLDSEHKTDSKRVSASVKAANTTFCFWLIQRSHGWRVISWFLMIRVRPEFLMASFWKTIDTTMRYPIPQRAWFRETVSALDDLFVSRTSYDVPLP